MTVQVNTIVASGAGGTLAAISAGVGVTGLAYITGTPAVGQVLTANVVQGLTATSWQWTRNGTNIAGATSSTYTVVSGDIGTAIAVVVNGILTSNAVNVPGIAPTVTTAPSVASASTSSPLTWTPGVYTGTPSPTVTANVYVNGLLVASNVTQSSYTPTLVGGSLVVTETASNSAGSVSSSSAGVTISATIQLRAAASTNYSSLNPTAYSVASATTVDIIVRQPFCLGATIPGIVLGQQNWGLTSTQGVKNTGNAITIVAAAIEISGVTQPVLFSGIRSATLADGTNLLSDELLASAFSLGSFARGTTGFVRIQYRLNGAALSIPQVGSPKGTGSGSYKFDNTKVNFTSGVDGTGIIAYTMINGGVNGTDIVNVSNSMPAPMIFGRHTDPATGMWGDSKTFGTSDTPTAWGTIGMNRLLHSDITQASTARSGINFGCPSGNAVDCTTPVGAASLSQLTYWYQYVNHAVVGYGTNAVFSGTSVFTNLYAQIRANSTITAIIQRSLTPRTTSTDSWATTGNQTPATGSGWGVGGQVQNLEASLLALVSTDTQGLSYYQSLGERSGTSGAAYWLFAVNGTANYATSDGLHEGGTAPGYELNIGIAGNYTTKTGGTVSTPLRTLVQAFT